MSKKGKLKLSAVTLSKEGRQYKTIDHKNIAMPDIDVPEFKQKDSPIDMDR